MAATTQIGARPTLTAAELDVYCASHRGAFLPDYWSLRAKLEKARISPTIPSPYVANVVSPLISFFGEVLKKDWFDRIFDDPSASLTSEELHYQKVIPELVEAIFQMGCVGGYYPSSHEDLSAFQSVVSILFRRATQEKTDTASLSILAPIAKWGGNTRGPNTLPRGRINRHSLQVNAGIVTMPLEHRFSGLIAWTALGHEVAGHNFLDIYPQIRRQVTEKLIHLSLNAASDEKSIKWATLTQYWAACTEELLSDILGVMTIGPAAAIGLISYFRGIRNSGLKTTGPLHSKDQEAKRILELSNSDGEIILTLSKVSKRVVLLNPEGIIGKCQQSEKDIAYKKHYVSRGKHPLDILRPLVQAHIVRLMGHEDWATNIEERVYNNLPSDHEILLLHPDNSKKNQTIDWDLASDSAREIAETVYSEKFAINENTPQQLKELVGIWSEEDITRTQELTAIISSQELPTANQIAQIEETGPLASHHLVACAVMKAIEEQSTQEAIGIVFRNMKHLLRHVYEEHIEQLRGSYTAFIPPPKPGDRSSEDLINTDGEPLYLYEDDFWH